jgi:hypothetical protein
MTSLTKLQCLEYRYDSIKIGRIGVFGHALRIFCGIELTTVNRSPPTAVGARV